MPAWNSDQVELLLTYFARHQRSSVKDQIMQGGIDINQFWKNLQKAYKQSRGTSSAFTLDVCADAK